MKWCFSLKNPADLIEPSDNLAQAYVQKSNDSLDMAQLAISNSKTDWAVTTMYYCQYLAMCALFHKIGIKCENHTCTLLIAEKFISSIDKKYIEQIKRFKAERIEKQYYVAKSDNEFIDLDKLNKETKEFQGYIIEKINTFSSAEIQDIRESIRKYKANLNKSAKGKSGKKPDVSASKSE